MSFQQGKVNALSCSPLSPREMEALLLYHTESLHLGISSCLSVTQIEFVYTPFFQSMFIYLYKKDKELMGVVWDGGVDFTLAFSLIRHHKNCCFF